MYASRRKRLLDQIEEGTIIISGAKNRIRNGDMPYRFRQDSNFHYLTGFPEPGAVALLQRKKGNDRFVLFVRPGDPKTERLMGKREGLEGAVRNYGADEAYSIADINDDIKPYLKTRNLYTPGSKKEVLGRTAKFLARRKLKNINGSLHDLRLRKSPYEIDMLRKAAQISALGHLEVMRSVRPGMNESDMEAVMDYTFRRNGATGPAFGTIAAGGRNALCLHYVANKDPLRDGDLLMMDAGAEYNMYAGDISTTFPVNGRFTDAQRELYDIVLKAQQDCIAAVKPGICLGDIGRVSKQSLDQACSAIAGMDLEKFSEISKEYLVHGPSHFLGLDVHDVGDKGVSLEPGMAFTVEPGLYIPEDDALFPEEYRGIGIRIEDDVLVTEDGCEVLSESGDEKLPRTPDEIEGFMRNNGSGRWRLLGGG